MALIFGEPESPTRVRVVSINYLSDDTSNGGYQINRDQVPEFPKPEVGINHVMYFNPETKEIWFEQETRELTSEEKKTQEIELLKTLVADLSQLLIEKGVL